WTKATVVMVITVILAVLGFFYWKNYYTPPPEEAVLIGEESTDLGSEIYREANNPIEGELPGNPLEGVYKNPFE
ncbi:MAG: hypothetical protein Q8P04_01860, partial [bacterium]|nr:hypothetical protein [bacterium]